MSKTSQARAILFLKILGLFVFAWTSFAFGQSQNAADIFGTKAYLENLMVDRFSRELATRVDSTKFQMSASIEVARVKRKPSLLLNDGFTDLDLGFLDPDKLLSQGSDNQMGSFLRNFEVRKITVMAGIYEELGEEVKAEVSTWLAKRVKDEFGSRGKSEVQFIKKPSQEKVADKIRSPLELLREFQELAGQIILFLAIILGVLFWKVLGGKKESGPSIKVNNKMEKGKDSGDSAVAPGGAAAGSLSTEMKEKESLQKQARGLAQDIIELTPKIGTELERVIDEWCHLGEPGFSRVAIFAEVVGQSLGRVPIPNEFHDEVTKVFSRMHNMNIAVKLETLTQVYWDLMAVINLGPTYLHQPFSYLQTASGHSMGEALMENNAEVQAVASMYMPREARQSYFSGLNEDRKMELLNVASQLDKINQDEFDKMESELAPLFQVKEDIKTVSVARALESLIEVMPYGETIKLLNEIKGPAIEEYKRTRPSLAFLHEWPDDALGNLVQHVGQQELMALLVVREDLYERVINFVPPRLKQIIMDDYKTAQKMAPGEIEQLLEKLHMNLVLFIDKGIVDLQTVFIEEQKASDSDDTTNGNGEESPAA